MRYFCDMKRTISLLLIIFFGQLVFAQGEYDSEVPVQSEEEFVGFNKNGKEKKDLSRIRIGGSAGLSLGNRQLGFGISPTVGYQVIEDRIEIGTGILYDYYRYKEPGFKYVENTVGSNNYVRIYVWEGLFAQFRGVYQKTYITVNTTGLTPIRLGNVFGGAGYQYAISEKVFVNFGLEINLIPYDLSVVAARTERIISPFFQIQFAL